MAEALLERVALPASDTLLVGDRLLTDVRMAHEAGMASALVLSGATPRSALADAPYTPDYVLDGVAQVLPPDRLEEVS
jgi:ribonucleotide monophosphatase NagD (HAD superfamily)